MTSKPLAALVVAIMFGGIVFSSAMGWWQTESQKKAVQFTEGEFAGQANPADIRGSYTFGDVETNFGIPAETLVEAFGVETDDPTAYPVKSLGALYLDSPQEVGTASVRMFVAFYLGLPFDLTANIYLPASAEAILRTRSLTPEQSAYLDTHTISSTLSPLPTSDNVTLPSLPTEESAVQETAVHSENTDTAVKGKTTFADVLAWGVTPEVIEQILGMPIPAATGVKIKDFCIENNLSFEPIRTALQVEVDKVK